MTSTNYKLLNKISHSKLFNLSRIISTQKQLIPTSNIHSRRLSISNTHLFQNNIHRNEQSLIHKSKLNFSTLTSISSADDSDDDDDSDSDLSDFSDFTDSDSDNDNDIDFGSDLKQTQQSNLNHHQISILVEMMSLMIC